MDMYKIACITETIQTFTVQELEFLHAFIHARLMRYTAYTSQITSSPTLIQESSGTLAQSQSSPLNIEISDPKVITKQESPSLISNQPLFETVKPLSTTTTTNETKKKSVRWSDIVATPPFTPSTSSSSSKGSEVKKVVTPKNKDIRRAPPSFKKDEAPGKVKRERRVPQSNPRESPVIGSQWISFCEKKGCECVYTFRDGLNCTDGKMQPSKCHDPDKEIVQNNESSPESSPEQQDADEIDPVRLDSGKIYDNQLYVRGWDSTIVKWESVRDRLYNELIEMRADIEQVYVDSKGFAFLTFSSHEVATKAQRILLGVTSFFGDSLLVNFATVRTKK